MKSKISVILCVAFILMVQIAEAQKSKREFYQLKIYSLANEQGEKLTDAFLKDAFIPALHRQGIKNVGAFKLVPNEKDTLQQIYLLIPFSSLSQFQELEAKLSGDKAYQQAGSQYLNASFDKAPYARIGSVLLQAFSDMPKMATPSFDTPRDQRIYELRSYESATEKLYVNKVDMFNAGGEVKLFDQLGFNAVFYGEVLSGPRMPNLMYMTTFSDKASRDEHWKSFSAAPEWKALSSMPKYQKNVSKSDIIFLYPTEYSDY